MNIVKKLLLPSILFLGIYTPAYAIGTETYNSHLQVPVAPSDQAADFQDEQLKNVILAHLGKPAGSILTKGELSMLTSLILSKEQSRQISSLKGLEQATNLNFFALSASAVTDFSPLETLTRLYALELEGDTITTATFPDLTGCPNLRILSITRAQLDNTIFPKLLQLTKLEDIRLDSNTEITTIEPLKALPYLHSVAVQFCGVNDFTVIKDFPALNDLAGYGQVIGLNTPATTLQLSKLQYDETQQSLFIPFSVMPDRLIHYDGSLLPFTTSVNDTWLALNASQVPASQLSITDTGITISGISKTDYENLTDLSYRAPFINPGGSYTIPDNYIFYSIHGGSYHHKFRLINAPVNGEPITVKHLNEAGQEIAPTETLTGKLNDTYKAEPKKLASWTLKQMPTNAEGYFTNTALEVVFVYEKAQGAPVTVRYLDENGATLAEDTVLSGKIDDPFTVEPKQFPSWQLKEAPLNTQGSFTSAPQTVTFIYEKANGAPVTVHYLDEQGNQLANPTILEGKIGEAYQVEAKLLNAWSLKSLSNNVQGVFTEKPQQIAFTYERKVTANDLPITPQNILTLEKNADRLSDAEPAVPSTASRSTAAQTEHRALPHTILQRQLIPEVTPTHKQAQSKNENTGTLTVKFVDEKGREIAAPATFKGKVGERYKLAIKNRQATLEHQ